MFASRGSDATLNTYVATRPLKVLYFDGFSASKGNPGSRDLQNLIAFGLDGEQNDDNIIAESLCKWGLSRGLDGFVREEANFEVIWVSVVLFSPHPDLPSDRLLHGSKCSAISAVQLLV
jgi:hypothetical protein